MSHAAIVFLVICWALYLVPLIWRFFSQRRTVDPIDAFSKQLETLQHVQRRGHVAHPTRTSKKHNRSVRKTRASKSGSLTKPESRRKAHVSDPDVVVKLRPISKQDNNENSTATEPQDAEAAASPPIDVHTRRTEIMSVLGGAVLLTFVAAVSVGGALIAIHVGFDVLFVAYVVAVLRITRVETSNDALSAPDVVDLTDRNPVANRAVSPAVRSTNSRKIAR